VRGSIARLRGGAVHSQIIPKLSGLKKAGDGYVAKCPAHEDQRQSLSVGIGTGGRVLLKCHAGCQVDAIVAALGLTMGDLFEEQTGSGSERREVACYRYLGEHGELLYEVVRFEPKDFRQRRPDGMGGRVWNLHDTRRVLYRLPELQGCSRVVVVEGEKDADRLWTEGIPATTNVGGAGKWRADYTQQLLAAGVSELVIIPDNDDPGRQHAAQVAASWSPKPSRMLTLPDTGPKGDVSDYLAKHPADTLRALLEPPREVLPWLDVDGQWDAMVAEDTEAVAGPRIYLNLPAIDNTLNGIRRGEVCGLMGRPGIGKTVLLTHVSEKVAEDEVGHVFFSLEMPAAQIVGRLQQRLYGYDRYLRERESRRGALDRERYRTAFRTLLIIDTPGLSISQMEGLLTRIQAGPFQGVRLGLVTIDHLGMVGGDRKLTTYDRVSVQAREIKELAKRFQCAVMLAVQVNREAGGDGSRELGLGSARDSGVVEEAMDYLLGLRRLDRSLEMPAAEREKYRDVIFVKVIKNRHGETDTRETAYRFNANGLQLKEDASFELEQDSIAKIAAGGSRRR
jgi:hypothetical protein